MAEDDYKHIFSADETGFGGTGFGEVSTPAPAPNTPAPTVPTPLVNPYGDKQVIPAKKITKLPDDFLNIIRDASRDLHEDLRRIGTIGPSFTQFKGIEPCPPCYTHIPPTDPDDEDDAGDCVYKCADDEVCQDGECTKDPDPPDPPCKATMRFSILSDDDRMCRVDAFNMVDSNDASDDGFSWSIEGQPGTQYSYVVIDRTLNLAVQGANLIPVPLVAEDKAMAQNYTAGSAQPRPRSFSGNLMAGVGYRIPAVTAECVPVKVHVTASKSGMKAPNQFNFYRDSADNLYLECLDIPKGKTYDGTFIVQLQYKELNARDSTQDLRNLIQSKMTFTELASQVKSNADYLPFMPQLNAEAIKSANIILERRNYSMESKVGDVIQDAVNWLCGFSCPTPKMEGRKILPIEMYLNTNAGACRHRAFIAFLLFNKLGLPTRFCANSCHAWPEFYDFKSRMWVQVDLGGCSPEDPEPCGSCTRPNPMYGLKPDEPECLPVVCAENHFCHPKYSKCIPDCDALHPDGDFHYNPKTDRCEECEDGRVWSDLTEICECKKCDEGFSMNEDGNCVDAEDNLSEDAPRGYYTDLTLNLCLPVPDCSGREGTVFNENTGQCDCPYGTNPKDPQGLPIPYTWNDEQEKCLPDVQKQCPEGEWWDSVMGRCRETPNRIVNPIVRPNPLDPEVLEDVIIEDGRVREALTGWLNPTTGQIIDKVDMKSAGENEDSLRKRGYTIPWENIRVSKNGKSPMAITTTLQGMAKWIESHDLDSSSVRVAAGWQRTNPINRLVYMLTNDDYDFDSWSTSWEQQFSKTFPTGRFSIRRTDKTFEVVDSTTS